MTSPEVSPLRLPNAAAKSGKSSASGRKIACFRNLFPSHSKDPQSLDTKSLHPRVITALQILKEGQASSSSSSSSSFPSRFHEQSAAATSGASSEAKKEADTKATLNPLAESKSSPPDAAPSMRLAVARWIADKGYLAYQWYLPFGKPSQNLNRLSIPESAVMQLVSLSVLEEFLSVVKLKRVRVHRKSIWGKETFWSLTLDCADSTVSPTSHSISVPIPLTKTLESVIAKTKGFRESPPEIVYESDLVFAVAIVPETTTSLACYHIVYKIRGAELHEFWSSPVATLKREKSKGIKD